MQSPRIFLLVAQIISRVKHQPDSSLQPATGAAASARAPCSSRDITTIGNHAAARVRRTASGASFVTRQGWLKHGTKKHETLSGSQVARDPAIETCRGSEG